MPGVSPVAGAVLVARYWPTDGVTLRARRSRPRRWLSRTVVEARVQSVAISIASPFTIRASSISACTVVAARRRTSPSLTSEQRSRPPMSATKALTRSRKRRAVAERPSRPGNRSLWFVTAERAREGSSHNEDELASMLALQLHFLSEVSAASVGLVSSPPERPCENTVDRDAPLSELDGDAADFLD